MSLTRLDHVAIEVNDIDHYVELLESTGCLRLIRWGVMGASGRRIAMLGDGTGMKIELAEQPSASAPRLLHLALRANDVDRACQTLTQDGWTVVRGPNPLPAAHAVSALLSNTEGFQLQVIGYEPTSPDTVEWTEKADGLARPALIEE
jgi:catechol 2,3-dioxygenase-like lactoylglutathione lyase family enzyme